MYRRWIALFLLVAVLAAGCAKEKLPTEVAQTPPAPALVTLKVGYRDAEHIGPLLDYLISAFQEEYPQYRVVRVKMKPLQSEAILQVHEGELDVVPVLFAQGRDQLLQPLDPFIRRDNLDLSGFRMDPVQFRWDGELYEMPYSGLPHLLVGNRTHFEAAGVAWPAEGWTWEQFRETAARLTRGDGESRVWGLSAQVVEQSILTWLQQRVGGPEWTAGEVEVAEAFQFFGQLMERDRSVPHVEPAKSGSYRPILYPVNRSKSPPPVPEVAVEMGSLGRAGIEEPWAVLPMPVLPGAHPVLRAKPFTLGIAAEAAEPEAAWEFIKFATGPKGARVVAAAGSLPAYRSPEAEALWQQGQPAALRYLAQLRWHSDSWYLSTTDSEYEHHSFLRKAIGKAVTRQTAWDQAAEEMFKGIERSHVVHGRAPLKKVVEDLKEFEKSLNSKP